MLDQSVQALQKSYYFTLPVRECEKAVSSSIKQKLQRKQSKTKIRSPGPMFKASDWHGMGDESFKITPQVDLAPNQGRELWP